METIFYNLTIIFLPVILMGIAILIVDGFK